MNKRLLGYAFVTGLVFSLSPILFIGFNLFISIWMIPIGMLYGTYLYKKDLEGEK